MDKRSLLALLLAVPFARPGALLAQGARQSTSKRTLQEIRGDWKRFLPTGTTVPPTQPPLTLSEGEWRKRLAPASFRVLREEGTEPPGSSPLNAEKRPGIFACAGCDLP